MLFTQDMELVISSVVLLMEPLQLQPVSPQQLEAEFGSVVDAAEGVVSPTGFAQVLRIPRRRLEIALGRNRWEFSSRAEAVGADEGRNMAEAVYLLEKLAPDAEWKAIGYNYVLTFIAPNNSLAIEAIGAVTQAIEEISRKLEYPVKGAATWLYMDVEGKRLHLRMEPRGGDPESRRIWAQANFHQQLYGELPDQAQLAEEFPHFYYVFSKVMERL